MAGKKYELGSLDVDLMRVFDAVMTDGNLTKAARRLGIAQPTVSNGLARLRLIFADELFQRTGHGVVPTARARQLAQPIRTAIAALSSATKSTDKFDPSAVNRTFIVELRPDLERLVATTLIQRVAAIAPAARVEIHSGRGERQLRFGEPELAVDTEMPVHEDQRCELLLEDVLAVLARKDHPRIGEKLSAADYCELSHVVLASPNPTDRSPVTLALAQSSLRQKIPFAVSDTAAILDLVKSTDLVATIGRRLACRFASRHDLTVYAMPLPLPALRYYQVWHRHFDDDAEHAWLRGLIKETCTGA